MTGDIDNIDTDVSLYRQMQRFGSPTVDDAANALGMTRETVSISLSRLEKLGLITHREEDPSSVIPVAPEVAAVRVLTRGREELARYASGIAEVHGTLDRIIDKFLTLRPDTNHELSFEVMTDLRQVAAYLDSASELARDEVLTMHPTPPIAPHLLDEGRERNVRHAGRGLRLRTIYQRQIISMPRMQTHLNALTALGYDIRVAPVVPVRMLIFDRRRAVVPIDPDNGLAGAIAIDGELFVRSLVAIFDFCWQNSSASHDLLDEAGDQMLTSRELAILRMLAAGIKDEKIARDLGVSLRTVTRAISELMRRLGAENRFQAGVRAAALGWID